MKKFISLVVGGSMLLIGAGCTQQIANVPAPTAPAPIAQQPAPVNQPAPQAEKFITIKWFYDEFLGQICIDGGDIEIGSAIAAEIGYPNKTTDHLCLNPDNTGLLAQQPEATKKGTARVVLGNLKLLSSEQGRIYSIDILNLN